MKQTELQAAYSPVSQGFHDALLSAVSEVQAAHPVNKRRLSLLAAALILALLCGTAFAIIRYYSVREYQAGGKPSAEFERLVVAIGETYENDYITLTVGDTIFDGRTIALTMNLYSKDESKPVFLFPRLTACCGDRELTVDIEGMRGDFHSGFLYPNILAGDTLEHQYGVDAAVFGDVAGTDVTWKLTLMVLAPNWPVANDETVRHGTEGDMPQGEYAKRFRDAYAHQQILATDGESLVEYVSAIYPDAYGALMADDPAYRTLGEQLADSGAFTLVDTLECTFATKPPEVKRVSGQTFAFDAYTVELDSLALSYLHADYSLRHIYPAGALPAENIYYELRDQNGTAFLSTGSQIGHVEDRSSITYSGSTEPARDGVTAITFVPYTFGADAQGVMRNRYDDAHAFTVELPTDE